MPDPNVPDAVSTGFFKVTPAKFTLVFIVFPQTVSENVYMQSSVTANTGPSVQILLL